MGMLQNRVSTPVNPGSPRNNLSIRPRQDRSCKLWDVNNGTCMETLRGHSDEVKLGNFVSKMMGSRLSEACLVGTPNCQSRGVFVILWPYLWGGAYYVIILCILNNCIYDIWLVVSKICLFLTLPGEDSRKILILTNVVQMGLFNHQLGLLFFSQGSLNYPLWRGQTMQMYDATLDPCMLWLPTWNGWLWG